MSIFIDDQFTDNSERGFQLEYKLTGYRLDSSTWFCWEYLLPNPSPIGKLLCLDRGGARSSGTMGCRVPPGEMPLEWAKSLQPTEVHCDVGEVPLPHHHVSYVQHQWAIDVCH